MLQQVRYVGLSFVLVGLILAPANTLAQSYVVEYSEDFSSDPGWTTDQPGNYYWDSGTETYHATTVNDYAGLPSPTRYAYTNVNYDGNSMRLEFDILFDSIGWSAGVMFGLFDQDLNLWPSSYAPDADSIFGSFGAADGGMYITLYVCDSGTGCVFDQVVNVTTDGTWYHCTIEYSTGSQEATLALQDIGTGVVVADLLIPGVTELKPELDFLGFARDPSGNDCCPSCSGYACSASATAHIDNVIYSEAIGAFPCDDFEDGVIDSSMWVTGGRRISWTPSDDGSWTWSNDEVVATDGYQRLRVEGPYTGNSYGAIAWVQTQQDFNDSADHVLNFVWNVDVSESHHQSYHIQVTDGYMATFQEFAGTPWALPGYDGTVGLLYDNPINRLNGKHYPSDTGQETWSVTISAGGVARLFDGPDATGSLVGEGTLNAALPWFLRFMVLDATSAGYGAGGPTDLNVYDFCSEALPPLCNWEPRASMPNARRFVASAVVDDKIYVFGGHLDNLNRVEVYDPQLDTWTQLADIPTGRGMAAAAAVDGIIYLIGGNSCYSNCWRTENEAYDPGTDSWTTKTPMQVTDRGGLTATAVDGLIYVMGGGDSYDPTSPYDIVEVYDPASDSWTTGVPMPRGRLHHGAVAIDRKIYLIGGATNNPYEPAPEVDVFDTESGEWTQIATLPTSTNPRIGLAAVTVRSRIYAIGGMDYVTGEYYSTVEEYDPQLDSWSAVTPLPSARGWHCAAEVDDTIYVTGGTDEANEYLDTTVASVWCPSPCGDGVVDPGEVCDDGNTSDCDGCRADCSAVETGCGDGFVCGTEECDDGNTEDFDGCSAVCTASDFEYVCRIYATPPDQDQDTNLPPTITNIPLGDLIYVEFVARDSGATNTGIVSVYADLIYPEDVATCYDPDNVLSSPLFDLFPGGVCDGLQVDELGGSQLEPNVGTDREWVPVAVVEFDTPRVGQAKFKLAPATTESSAHGRGLVSTVDIAYGECTVEVVCPCAYDLDDNCTIAGGDLGLFAPCWSLCEGDPAWDANSCGEKDFDCSSCVSGGDLGWFAVGWNRTCDEIDPLADYPACRECDGPVYCAEAAVASTGGVVGAVSAAPGDRASGVDQSVLLSMRFTNLSGQSLATSRVGRARGDFVRAGEHVLAELWAKDLSPTTEGLTVVFADALYDPSQFEVVSIDSGETFTLFSIADSGSRDGVVRAVGGATLERGHGAGAWTRVAGVELKALANVSWPAISLRPSEGEAISRYGQGLVPADQIRVVPGHTEKPDVPVGRLRKSAVND